MRSPAIAFVLALSACAHGTLRQEAGSASEWKRYRSVHFRIDVERWDRDPARLVAAFEELHAAVLASLVSEPVDIPGHLRVIVLASRLEVQEATCLYDIGGLFWISKLGEPVILLAAEDVDAIPQIIAHELTHYVSRYLFPRQPYWFAEGLAQFVEGVAKPDREGRRWAGADPTSGWFAGSVALTPAESLFRRESHGSFEDPYVTSWILYRFLWNQRGAQLSRYQRALSEGVAPDDAWSAAFPEWDPAKGKLRMLDNDLTAYQRAGRGLRWEVKAADVTRTFTLEKSPTRKCR